MLTYNNLHPYQKRVIVKSLKIKYGYHFLDTGLGKTVIAFAIHDQLTKRNLIKRSLVVCPKYVMNHVWKQEAAKWDFSSKFKLNVIHGSTTNGSAEYSRRWNVVDDADIYLINYEGLMWLSEYLLKHPSEHKWGCVFYDESTRMKKPGTKRFKAFKRFMRQFKYRFALTGTPIPNGLEDIFGQAYIVDQGWAYGTYITGFRKTYMEPKFTLHGRVTVYGEKSGPLKEEMRQKAASRIADRVIRLKKTEHLTLPEVKYHDVVLELPDDLRDMYKQIENDFFLEVGEATIETFSAVAAAMKLRQFLQGRVYSTNGDATYIHKMKLKALMGIELDGNALVAYNFKFERDDLRGVLPGNSPFLDSRTKDSESEKWIIGWNNYEYPHFLVNPASAAYGLNLQAGGNNVIWYSLTYNAEHYSQLIDRLWRQGQQKTVNVYHIVFKGTIDMVIAKALRGKNLTQSDLLNRIATYVKGGR